MRAHTLIIVGLLLLAPLGALSVGAIDTTDADPLAGHPKGSFLLEDGAIAVPLGLPTPADYTPEIHEKVLAASAKGLAYDAVNDREVMLATNFLFIRPGAWMWSPSWCTMNFIYGTPGKYQIGSAGHCNDVGDPVVIVVYPGVFVNIGTTSTSTGAASAPGNDYSLTTISPIWQSSVDADTAEIGGPQGGAYTGTCSPTTVRPVKQFGHGVGIGTGGTPRAGQCIAVMGSTVYYALPVIFGDSGSPLLTATTTPRGQALAVVTHLVIGGITYTGLGMRIASIPGATVVDGNGDFLTPP